MNRWEIATRIEECKKIVRCSKSQERKDKAKAELAELQKEFAWEMNHALPLAEGIWKMARYDYINTRVRMMTKGINVEDYLENEERAAYLRHRQYSASNTLEEQKELKARTEARDLVERYFDVVDFVKGKRPSGWSNQLLLGVTLTPDDILTDWERCAEEEHRMRVEKPRATSRGKRLSQETIDRIIEMHNEGRTVKEICEELNVSAEPVRKYSKGYQPQKTGGKATSPETIKTIFELRKQGLLIKEITEQVDVSYQTVRRYLQKGEMDDDKRETDGDSD